MCQTCSPENQFILCGLCLKLTKILCQAFSSKKSVYLVWLSSAAQHRSALIPHLLEDKKTPIRSWLLQRADGFITNLYPMYTQYIPNIYTPTKSSDPTPKSNPETQGVRLDRSQSLFYFVPRESHSQEQAWLRKVQFYTSPLIKRHFREAFIS